MHIIKCEHRNNGYHRHYHHCHYGLGFSYKRKNSELFSETSCVHTQFKQQYLASELDI